MTVKVDKTGSIPLLHISGEASGHTSSSISKKLESLLDLPGETVGIDLSETWFLDSHCLGVILFMWKKYRENRKNLVIIQPNHDMSLVLEQTNLNKIFTIIDGGSVS